MNPKSASNLDPKLKETYERIMGTGVPFTPTVNQTSPLQQPQETENTSTPLPQNPPTLQVQEVAPEPLYIPKAEPAFIPKVEPVSNEMVQSPDFSAKNPFPDPLPPPPDILGGNTALNVNPTTPKKKNKLKPVLIGFGGILFLAIYAIIWAKVFSLF